jgi:hypothetical protein
MAETLKPIPLAFWKTSAGREWLNDLPREDKRTIGRDIAQVQFGWPIGVPRFAVRWPEACGKSVPRYRAIVRRVSSSPFTREC